MARKQKNKPVTKSDKVPIKKQKSHKIIGKLHELNKKREQLKKADVCNAQKEMMKSTIEKSEEEIGGLDTYQKLSKSAEKHHGNFNSAVWVCKELQALNLMSEDKKLSLLDVGALDLNYKKYSATIEATYIDLNPQVPEILKEDFLTFKSSEEDIYDVIVLSLVMNFVGDPDTRGEMLLRAKQLIRQEGHLVVVLPLACVDNSRYLTCDIFSAMLNTLNFQVLKIYRSRKLIFFLAKKSEDSTARSSKRKFPKKLMRSGGKMNNFCIILS